MADPSAPPVPDMLPMSPELAEPGDSTNTGAPAVIPDVVPADSLPFVGQRPPKLPPPDRTPSS